MVKRCHDLLSLFGYSNTDLSIDANIEERNREQPRFAVAGLFGAALVDLIMLFRCWRVRDDVFCGIEGQWTRAYQDKKRARTSLRSG